MIVALTGTITKLLTSSIYLNVQQVEYEVHVALNVFEHLQKHAKEKEIHLYIYHLIKEEEQRLFGFIEITQRDFFQTLLLIRGIGPNLALSLLSHLSLDHFFDICKTKEITKLTRIPRVGKSIAETMVFEVNKKIDKWERLLIQSETKGSSPLTHRNYFSQVSFLNPEKEMALQALLQLGYKEKDALEAMAKIEAQQKKDNLNNKKSDDSGENATEKKEMHTIQNLIEASDWIRAVLQII